jgi:uncharacterized protein YjiS (DUF1127 family)
MPATLSHRALHGRRFSLLSALASAHETWRQRHALARLDDAALRDVGLTHEDVTRELRRGLWDAPDFWRN